MARVLRLPDHGRLLVATDLQGCLRDFVRMERIFRAAEDKSLGEVHLLFTGDLIHGPRIPEDGWPDYLGEFYKDESPKLIDRFIALQERFPKQVHSLLGNHEHGHIGGPHTAKFAYDEVALLESILGPKNTEKLRRLFRDFPLVAVAPCGIVFTHGAPAAHIRSIAEIEAAKLDGITYRSPVDILHVPVIGQILWARSASAEAARKFVGALGGRVSVFGHDVVPQGFERVGDEQIIISTSFGVADAQKVYLDIDLSRRFDTVHDLREGIEIVPLYPQRQRS
ncbi:MAG: metallophosphoesterase [Deltaproteobacteria bacterium]|nr:metallophosphoesterase [Deltaproteobacteria bacterium]